MEELLIFAIYDPRKKLMLCLKKLNMFLKMVEEIVRNGKVLKYKKTSTIKY